MKLGKAVVKCRILILILAVALLIPAVFGMIYTRVNYDMLNYLPEDLDTVKGQKYMLEDFDKGAFSFLIFEDMDDKSISNVTKEIKKVDHVASVLAYSDISDGSIPKELLPDDLYKAFNSGDDTLVAVFFDTSSSSDETMEAISQIRGIAGKQCLVSGISAMVTDLRDLRLRCDSGSARDGCNDAFPRQLDHPVCVPLEHRSGDPAEYGHKLLYGRNIIHHQGAVGGASACRHDGLLDIPVAQLRRAQA